MSAAADRWSGTAALVVGLGASGLAAAELLLALGARVRGYDRRSDLEGLPAGLVPFLGSAEIPDAALVGVDRVVLSPGVPPAPVRARVDRVCPTAGIEGELSLGLAVVRDRVPAHLPTVLVTGTNGKSTVTALTGHLLAAGGLAPFVGGNLGTPLCRLARAIAADGASIPGALVLECSSFQLETLPPVPTDVGMVLNLTPDHLDRHPTMAEYAAVKARVFAGLSSSGLALADFEDARHETVLAGVAAPRIVRVGVRGEAWIDGDVLHVDGDGFPRTALPLAGRHNAKNALFSLAAARHLGVPAEACLRALASFRGLPHRMTPVGEVDGVAYYDDSKATNVASVLASLDGFERPFVLIAGGRAKGDDPTPLRALLSRGGRGFVGIGEAGPALCALIDGVVPVRMAPSLAEAVAIARDLAGPGDAVVLSPACASYDQFSNYAERGDAFAAAVRGLIRRT